MWVRERARGRGVGGAEFMAEQVRGGWCGWGVGGVWVWVWVWVG